MSDQIPDLAFLRERTTIARGAKSKNECEAEFDRAIAKVKAEALREAAAIVYSEEHEQWRMDRGGGVYGVRMPGAQIVAQRMQVVGKVIRNRADTLDPS